MVEFLELIWKSICEITVRFIDFLTSFNWAIVISIIALGVSFIYTMLNYNQSKMKIDVQLSEKDRIHFKVKEKEDDYREPFRVLIYATIINESSKPISIYKIEYDPDQTDPQNTTFTRT